MVKTRPAGYSADERAARKAQVPELRTKGERGAKKADGLQALLDAIAKMTDQDRLVAERVHATAPELLPQTWCGMPAYTNADGKVVLSPRCARIRLTEGAADVLSVRGGVGGPDNIVVPAGGSRESLREGRVRVHGSHS